MRDYPHHVQTWGPKLLEHGKRLAAMLDWHRARGIDAHHGSSRMVERDRQICEYVRWCFADAETAEAFASEFGGARTLSRAKQISRY